MRDRRRSKSGKPVYLIAEEGVSAASNRRDLPAFGKGPALAVAFGSWRAAPAYFGAVMRLLGASKQDRDVWVFFDPVLGRVLVPNIEVE
jgi:hypothetical protein